jgi:hypothetical protein
VLLEQVAVLQVALLVQLQLVRTLVLLQVLAAVELQVMEHLEL